MRRTGGVCACVRLHGIILCLAAAKCLERRRKEHSQLRGPLLLLVRAMPLSTRTVSNNALRLVPTPDRCLAAWPRAVRPRPVGL